MHLAYLKFGFGRATTDASIDIKMGKLSIEDAKKLIKKNDHVFPNKFLESYLEYFSMSKDKFFSVLESHRNQDIFEKKGDNFYLKDVI